MDPARALLAVLASLTALCTSCSSGSGSFSGSASDAGDARSHDAGSGDPDGGKVQDSALTSSDSAKPTHEGGAHEDAMVPSLLTPDPPPGAVKCGSGTFTSAAWAMVCMMPSDALDDAPLPDGGIGVTPRACSAVTVSSGAWDVWCTATEAYIWARVDGATNAGVLADCHGVSLLMIDEGVYASGASSGNEAEVETFEPDGTEIAGTPPGMTQTIAFSTTVGNAPHTDGSADLFVLASLEDSCVMGAFGPATVIGGFTVTWKN